MFFEAADTSVCVRKPFLIVHANENVRWDYVHPKITKFRFCSCSRLGIMKLLLLYKNIVPNLLSSKFLIVGLVDYSENIPPVPHIEIAK